MTNTYKINSIDQVTGNVNVTFSVDNKAQVISKLPVNDADALDAALVEYGLAYERGLAVQQVAIPAAVTAMVGKSRDVLVKVAPVEVKEELVAPVKEG